MQSVIGVPDNVEDTIDSSRRAELWYRARPPPRNAFLRHPREAQGLLAGSELRVDERHIAVQPDRRS